MKRAFLFSVLTLVLAAHPASADPLARMPYPSLPLSLLQAICKSLAKFNKSSGSSAVSYRVKQTLRM